MTTIISTVAHLSLYSSIKSLTCANGLETTALKHQRTNTHRRTGKYPSCTCDCWDTRSHTCRSLVHCSQTSNMDHTLQTDIENSYKKFKKKHILQISFELTLYRMGY